MRIARSFAATLAVVCLLATAAYAAPGPFTPGPPEAGAATLIYDAADGNVSLDTGGLGVTTFEVRSAGGLFIPGNISADIILPPFDLITPEKLFKLSTDGIGNTNFGNILPAGLSQEALVADLLADGSFAGGGNLARDVATSPHLQYIPEPASAALLGLGGLLLMGLRRRS